MALSIGSKAPDFTVASTSGKNFTLSKDMAGKACILYFYPKDFTSVCTAEACDFRDNIAHFADMGIEVIGISRDSVATHLRFKKANELPFELLADEDGKVSKAYKAQVPLIGMTKRITYLIDQNHQIATAYDNLFGAKQHIKEMITKMDLIA
jgi:peroxiredoxin Q/BCP